MQHLETLVRDMLHLHDTYLIPKKQSVTINKKGELFGSKGLDCTNSTISMGKFYEIISQSFYGGEIEQDLEIIDENGNETTIRPDLINIEDNVVSEIKACQKAIGFLLQDRQIEFYKTIQRRFLDKHTKYPQIDFILYAHSFEGVKSFWNGTRDEMYNELVPKTLCSIVLPFNLVLKLHNPDSGSNNLVYRYDNDKQTNYDVGTKVRPGTVVRLFKEPEKVIEELGLKSSQYTITRLRVPRGMHIILDRCKRIKQFPIVQIKYNNYDKWAKTFVKEYLKDVPF